MKSIRTGLLSFIALLALLVASCADVNSSKGSSSTSTGGISTTGTSGTGTTNTGDTGTTDTTNTTGDTTTNNTTPDTTATDGKFTYYVKMYNDTDAAHDFTLNKETHTIAAHDVYTYTITWQDDANKGSYSSFSLGDVATGPITSEKNILVSTKDTEAPTNISNVKEFHYQDLTATLVFTNSTATDITIGFKQDAGIGTLVTNIGESIVRAGTSKTIVVDTRNGSTAHIFTPTLTNDIYTIVVGQTKNYALVTNPNNKATIVFHTDANRDASYTFNNNPHNMLAGTTASEVVTWPASYLGTLVSITGTDFGYTDKYPLQFFAEAGQTRDIYQLRLAIVHVNNTATHSVTITVNGETHLIAANSYYEWYIIWQQLTTKTVYITSGPNFIGQSELIDNRLDTWNVS